MERFNSEERMAKNKCLVHLFGFNNSFDHFFFANP